ncbi:MAG: 50S ribosomal protein L27 [Metamycoplasmataceae bacterium]
MAKTKAAGSSKNGRDSDGRRLGWKLSDGQYGSAGSIIFRQRGTKIHPGDNVGRGNDDTLYSLIDGYIKYENKRNRKIVSVYPERIVTPKVTKPQAIKKAPKITKTK